MPDISESIVRDPDLEWLDHVRPTGLVLSPTVIKERTLVPERQTQADTAQVGELLGPDDRPALADPWAFIETVLGWDARYVAGAPGGPTLPEELTIAVPEHETVLAPDWAVQGFDADAPWQLLVQLEPPGVDPDKRGAAEGWEATPHQRFERLLRETRVFAGVMISDRDLRLVYAPRGETSGWLAFPLGSLATVAGRPMLAGLKLALGAFRLFNAPAEQRLRALLKESREAQAAVSTALAEQVLGALHELLRGFQAAEPDSIGALARRDPHHLYEGLLSVLMRLVFVLYAEDRDLIPSRTDAKARKLYDDGYSVRGLYAKLSEDAALNPDTMDERHGGWGRLLALFRLIHKGHPSGFVIGRRGKLFDPDVFPFLEGRAAASEPPRVAKLTDGCVLRVLEDLMTVREPRTRVRQRLSYRTLDVEQIGSVYETVMGFTIEVAPGRVLAIRAGKNNRTPVFADLDALARLRPAERPKYLKEACHRGGLSQGVEKAVKAAADAEGMAAALEAIVDERGAPGKAPLGAGTPILQPTEERRRTGSHYTPRALTEPIVRHALQPALDRLGPEARPEAILDLKVCDPAMGSGAFLVEACRQIAERLVRAWAHWPETRPAIPADEDEELHARRLIAMRCLYGVDRNPMAADLGRLSLWLATLARDHEFTFLDHAIKSGDSLVGLDVKQVEALHWDATQADVDLGLMRGLVKARLEKVDAERRRIREAVEDATEEDLRPILKRAEKALEDPKLIGDAVIAAFFAADRPRAREAERVKVRAAIEQGTSLDWQDRVRPLTAPLRAGSQPVTPFHWPVEFPEVFDRANPGFDAVIGNPPFAGKNTIIAANPEHYLDWMQTLHAGAHGNADLVAHFFRRAFALLRQGGCLGLIATNTLRQGDTRATGLRPIRRAGGTILHAERRIKWPGEAAVVISTVHIHKGPIQGPFVLDGREVERITAYLFHAGSDDDPATLVANADKSFQGSIVLGMGFTFDDSNTRGVASPLAEMHRLIAKDPRNAERIFPYIGGEEVNTSPTHAHHRWVINFEDFPLERADLGALWDEADGRQRREWLRTGIVPLDYPEPVAADWPDLFAIVRERVKPDRTRLPPHNNWNRTVAARWWLFGAFRRELSCAIAPLDRVLAIARVGQYGLFCFLPKGIVYSEQLVVQALQTNAAFAALQCRVHEVWARFFASSMKDDLRYTPSDCFETFPFPEGFESDARLEAAGEAYYRFRAELMVARDKGLTKTYNLFHDRGVRDDDIRRLRELHAEMDRAVLRAYGWHDLAERAGAAFLDEATEDEFAYQGRLFWPSDVRDEVLARLLALNATRHAEEVRAASSRR
ncbi:MAG: hypothetical protein EA405_08660 [Rhodospirillales bacterium]|nr:MAG: hypothetical protein EA405_08660 [Rhodospirillales bacterium]